MKINLKELKKWIAALDSGNYSQTKNTLEDEYGYCCLGVACKVLIPEENIEYYLGYLSGSLPIDQSYAPQWLKDLNGLFGKKTGTALSELNDYKNMSFGEIATCLELVFIHKMLD